jgi:hypothetical protein
MNVYVKVEQLDFTVAVITCIRCESEAFDSA